MKTKKTIAMFLVIIFLLSIAIGCQTGDTSSEQSEQPTIEKQLVRYVYPGSVGDNHAEITDYINELLDKDNMNIEFVPVPVSWDVWEQKTNLMLTTGEEFELMQVLEGFGPGYTQQWARGASIRLNELLDEYAPTLTSLVPEWLWEAAVIDGNITTIPAFWVETANNKGGITMRKGLLDQFELEIPKNSDELINVSIAIQEKLKDEEIYEKTAYAFIRYQEIQTFLHREYESYPFTVIDQMLLVTQEGEVSSWLDSAEFKKDADFYNKAYTQNLIAPDILSMPLEALGEAVAAGNYLFAEWYLQQEGPGHGPGFESIYIAFNPDKPVFRDQGIRNSNIVSKTSPNPDAAVRFHEWIYSHDYAFKALTLGIDGLTYNQGEGNTYEWIREEQNLLIYDWMISNINLPFLPVVKETPQNWIDLGMKEDMNAVNSVTIGFAFDPSPVEIQFANSLSVTRDHLHPMRAGVISYDSGYGSASNALKAAGIDDVIAEYQKQLKAYLDSKN